MASSCCTKPVEGQNPLFLRAEVLPTLRQQAEAAQQRLVPVIIDLVSTPLATLRQTLQGIAEVAGVRHGLDDAVRWHRHRSVARHRPPISPVVRLPLPPYLSQGAVAPQ